MMCTRKQLAMILVITALWIAACGGGGTQEPQATEATPVPARTSAITEQGKLEIGGTPAPGELTNAEEKHRYTLNAASGAAILIRISATGDNTNAPDVFLYDPRNFLILNTDTAVQSPSKELTVTLQADGTHTLVVQGDAGAYELIIEPATEN
jgi:hypothetical protein